MFTNRKNKDRSNLILEVLNASVKDANKIKTRLESLDVNAVECLSRLTLKIFNALIALFI